MTRQTVHAIIAGRSSVGDWLEEGWLEETNATPQFWNKMQANHTLWEIERL